MNRALSYTSVLLMLAGLSLPVAAQVPPTLLLPGGALNQTSTPGVTVVNINTATVTQTTATFHSIPSGYAISNRAYNGWCVDPFSDFASNPPYQLISTYDAATLANPPGGGRAQNPNWNKVNWVLNNKATTGTVPTWVTQQVIWKLLAGQYIDFAPDGGRYPNPNIGFSLPGDQNIADALYAAANLQGSFIPGPGQVAGVMLYLDGINPDGTSTSSNIVVTKNGINPLIAPLNGLNGRANQLQEILIEVPVPTGAIGDFVWQDTNHNGIQDAGEPGINGVTLKLFNSGGTLVATTVTATNGPAQGYYQFTGLPDDTYTVVVDTTSSPLTGLVASPSTVGGNIAIDSNGSPATVTITAGSVDETIDFGFQTTCTGQIGDFVWNDYNQNGIQDAGEPGIPSVTVNLYDSTGSTLLKTTTTNGSGNYNFSGVCAGTYTVRVDATTLPQGFTPAPTSAAGSTTATDSNGSPAIVTLATDSSTDFTVDFGYLQPCTGQLGFFVWHDLNRNGLQDAGEPGINGVTLALTDSQGHAMASPLVTFNNGAINGYYQFNGVCAGTYTVTVTGGIPTTQINATPVAWTLTTANVGTDNTVNSRTNPTTVTLTQPNSTNETINFGYQSPCDGTIGYLVWNDANQNGLFDAGEAGIGGVTVNLRNPTDNTLIQTTTTDASGAYHFYGRCGGSYKVEVVPPSGYTPDTVTPGTPGANVGSPFIFTLPDDTDDENVNFGYFQTGTLIANVFLDSNDNGAKDGGETGLTGWTVTVTGTNGVTFTQTQQTDSNGNITPITGLVPGSYSVCVTPQTGYTETTPTPLNNCYPVTVPPNGTGSATFGYFQPGGLIANVFLDANDNAAKDASETGLQNWSVTVTGTNGITFTQTQQTDASGNITPLTGLIPGVYNVCVTPQAGYTETTPTPLNNCFGVTVPAGGTGSATFGYYQPGMLNANVFLDSNANTTQDNGEPGLPNWTITVTGTGGSTYSSVNTTGPAGSIPQITGLLAGTYQVCLTLQTGYTQTTPLPVTSQCVNVLVPAGGNGSATFGVVLPVTVACSSTNSGEVGAAFNSPAPSVSGGTAPYTFSLAPGSTLPAGLSLDASTGAITGTPTAAGTFTLQVKDSKGLVAATTCPYTIIAAPTLACSAVTSGEVGQPFNSPAPVTTGGAQPLTFSIATGALPAGLNLNASTGAITGTPTAAGSFTIKVTDANNVVATTTCPYTIVAAPTLACSAVTNGEVGQPFNSPALTTTGGAQPLTFSIATGALPAGLSLNASTGAITGTPTAAGSFTIKVTDANSVVATTTCPYTIVAAPTLACSAVTNGEVGQPFNSPAPVTTGGAQPLTFSIATGALPAGLNLNASTGAITGTPTAAGSFTIKVTDANNVVATTTCPYTIVAAPTLACSAVTNGEVGQPFNSPALTTTGGVAPLTFSIATGVLPAGLNLNASTGAITGTPTAAGSFTIKVTDANNVVATTTCPYTIVAAPTLACSGTSAGEVGQPFNSPAMTVYGGSGSYTFSVATGALPTGLTLNASTGAITGTPQSFGNFTIKVTDGNNVVATSTCPFVIAPAPTIACSVTNTGEVGLAFNSSGALVTGTTGPYTYSIATGILPTGLTLNPSTGAITGTPTVAGAFTIKVTDANGVTVTSTCPFTITTGPSVSCAASSATVGKTYSSAFAAGGGMAPYTYSISSGSLPPGLTLNSATGAITGTPTKAGTYPYSIKAVDGNGAVTYSSCSIIVAPSPIDLECGSCGTTGKATVGTPYKSNLAVTGGTGPYTYTIIQGSLPSGLALNSSTGAVSGTPTIPGTYTFTSEVTDANGNTDTAICTIVVQAASIDLECGTCAAGKATVGTSYSAALAVTGGVGPYTYSITYGSLPPGLTLNASTGVVSGTPTTPGTFTFTSKVVDSQGNWDTTTCSITVVGSPINLACGSCGANSTSVGASYSAALSVTGAKAPYTYSIVSGSLPPGLTLNSSTGVISGSPTTTGSYTFTSKVVDANGNSDTATCTINVQAPPIDLSCGTCGASSGKVGSSYSALYARAGGKAPFTYSITSGSLPPGLSLNASTGAITGTPTMAGSFTFTAKVLDANGATDTATCTIVITGSSLNLDCGTCGASKATVGASYSATYAVSGGTGSFTYSIVSGSLPPGLKLSGATISGTPTTPGSYTFTAKVTDSKGNTDTQSCTVVVIAAPIDIECGSCGTGNANTGVAYSATFAVTGATGSVSFSIVSGSLPPGMTLNAGTGTISGSPTTAGTYTFTAKVVDSKGNSDTTTCTITVLSSVLDIQCGTCGATKAMVGTGYSASFAATGGAPSYTYSISSGSLPAGLTLNASTGALSGTPTASGTFTFTSKVTDSKGKTDTVTCTLVVQPSPINLNCGSCSAGKAQVGSPFSASLSATGGTGALTYSIVSGSLPPGLTLNTSTGAISGTPTTGGTYTYTSKVVDSKGSSDTSTCTIVVNAPPVNLACGTCGASKANKGAAYSATLQVTGGSGKETFSIASGSLPPGVTLNASTGVISGSPTTAGTYTFTSKATDANGTSDTATCTIVVSQTMSAGSFTTYTQGGWGASPNGNNPGALLAKKFSSVYSGGSVSIGGSHKLTFTTALSIQNFLPQGGWPGMLTTSATNPTGYTPAGVLAGQVLALQLNVDFSNKGITALGLANLQVAYGPLKGQTVSQVLTMANAVLGGSSSVLPYGVSISDLNGVVDSINNNFDSGNTNNGFLK